MQQFKKSCLQHWDKNVMYQWRKFSQYKFKCEWVVVHEWLNVSRKTTKYICKKNKRKMKTVEDKLWHALRFRRTGNALLVKGANGRESCGWIRYQAASSDGWRWRVWLLEACGLTQSEETIVAQRLENHPWNPTPSNIVAYTSEPHFGERSLGWFCQCQHSGKSSDCNAYVCLCVKVNVYIWTVKGCGSQWISCCLRFTIRNDRARERAREKSWDHSFVFPADKSTIAAAAQCADWKLNSNV